MKKTDMTIVRVGKAIACQLAGTFLVVATGLSPCVASGYENDEPEAVMVAKTKSPPRPRVLAWLCHIAHITIREKWFIMLCA